jgi:hypothetical protein
VPFVLIQIIMVGLVIAIPAMVMVYKAGESTLDPNKIEINIPQEAPPAPSVDEKGTALSPSEQGKKDDEDAAKSLQDAFKATTPGK